MTDTSHSTDELIANGIAIISTSGRFPGCPDVDSFWSAVADGRELNRRLSPEELTATGVDAATMAKPNFVPVSNSFDGIDLFDNGFFGMTPGEAAILDPQHRHLLECTQILFDEAGYVPRSAPGRVGVYLGIGFPSYLFHNIASRPEVIEEAGAQRVFFGNDKGFAAMRLSHAFNFTGPSTVVDTACSSSLAAVHQACRSLAAYDCDFAVAGGASVLLPMDQGYTHEDGGITARDGHCRPFDAQASGTLFASGVGLVLLKRLEDALADGDTIIATILGSAMNNDGSAKAGFTAPSADGQAEVIQEALALANIPAETLGYVEAHGTGTILGDPIEFAGLTKAIHTGAPREVPCVIGSVKANLGHLDAAAGVAGLIKTAQALRHRKLPPSPNFSAPNPRMDFQNSPFQVNTQLRDWEAGPTPRRAGVSSFGIGGSNVHLVLEEAPAEPKSPSRPGDGPQLLAISARTPEALERTARELAETLDHRPDLSLTDVAGTLRHGRATHRFRQTVVARTTVEAATRLRALPATKPEDAVPERPPRVIFLFPGQGTPIRGCGQELYHQEPVFRRAINRCAEGFSPLLGRDIARLILDGESDEARAALATTRFAQPVIFSLCHALAMLWRSWGIEPAAMVGHSLGEYVAACVAGVLDLDDAIGLIAERAALMQDLPGGAMLAVPLSEEALRPLLTDGVEIAAINAPDRCVVAGPAPALATFETRLAAAGHPSGKWLDTSHAFHTAAVDGALPRWRDVMARVPLYAPAIPYASNLTGGMITPEQTRDPKAWCDHMRAPVRFADGLAAVTTEPGWVLLEVGPGALLTALAQRSVPTGGRSIASLGQRAPDSTEREALQGALGALWRAGVTLDWETLSEPTPWNRVRLPSYPFERQRHWIEARPKGDSQPAASKDGTGEWGETDRTGSPPRTEASVWRWRRSSQLEAAPLDARDWLVFGEADLVELTAMDLADRGHRARQMPGPIPLHPTPPEARDGAILVWSARTDGDAAAAMLTDLSLALSRTAGGRRPLLVVAGPPSPSVEAVFAGLMARPTKINGHRVLAHGATLSHALRQELDRGLDATRVAHRDDGRFVDSEAPLEAGAGLLTTGCSIILGDASLAFPLAEHLGRTRAGRTILVRPRPALDAEAILARDGGPGLSLELSDLAPDLTGNPTAEPPNQEALEAILNRLCAVLARDYVRQGTTDWRGGARFTLSALREDMGVLPKFHRFFDLFTRILIEDGFLTPPGETGEVEVLVDPEDGPKAAALVEEARAMAPSLSEVLDFLVHCASHFGDALSGREEAVGVLFEDGSTDRIDRAFSAMLAHSNYQACTGAIHAALSRIASSQGDRPLRILEVGAGKGELTRAVSDAPRHGQVEWWFTDMGSTFVRQAEANRDRFGPSRMVFKVFDISADPAPQNLPAGTFDIILGFDVVHATPHIRDALGNLSHLLAPNGLLILLEAVRNQRWIDMIWGLAEGWWYFEDLDLRQTSPLVPLEGWTAVLGEGEGERAFASVLGTTPGTSPDKAEYAVITAQRPASPDHPANRAIIDRRRETAAREDEALRARLGEWRERGIPVTALAASSPATEDLSRALDEVRAEFGPIGLLVQANGRPDAPPSRADARSFETLCRTHDPALAVHIVTGDASDAAFSSTLLDRFQADNGRPAITLHWQGPTGGSGEEPAFANDLGRLMELASGSGARRVDIRPAMGTSEGAAAPDLDDDGPEGRVLALWRQLFAIPTLTVDDNFHEVGGDSLLASQLVARTRERFGVSLTVRELFENATPKALAAWLSRERSDPVPAAPPLEPRKVPRTPPLPLSQAQKALWFAHAMQGPSATYNIPGAIRLIGALDHRLLIDCLKDILKRHEILRTTFLDRDGVPEAQISASVDHLSVPLEEADEDSVERIARAFTLHPFELDSPLFQLRLLKVAPERHVLLVNMHHIISDGWSLGILVDEITELYSARQTGRTPALPPLEFQYADFVAWEERLLAGPENGKQLAYWKSQLTNLPTVSPFPTDRERPAVQKIRGAVHRFHLSTELTKTLRALASREGATLYMILLAGFKVLIGHHARTEDVVVGTTVANRPLTVFETMIGLFVNNLVLRTDLGGRPTFLEALRRVKATTSDAFAHQSLPFVSLVRAMNQERSLSHAPLFQILFVLQKLNLRLELPGLTAETIDVPDLHTKFDLTLFTEEMDDGIACTFIYNSELFDGTTIEKYADQLSLLLNDIANDPTVAIEDLNIETQPERQERVMNEERKKESRVSSLRSARRKAISTASTEMVGYRHMTSDGSLPLVIEPLIPNVDLVSWASMNKALLEGHLLRHGAVLFRGFGAPSIATFEAFAGSMCTTLFGQYGDLPKEVEGMNIYTSTPYPANREILFHNESSHMHEWPKRQFFTCQIASESGGQTPIVDCRRVYQELRPKILGPLVEKGLKYVRNFIPSVDVSWSYFFKTNDRSKVEARCAEMGMGFSWRDDGGLSIWRAGQAVIQHPTTGERSFFNQIALHHPSCLDPETRSSLESLYGPDRLPRNVLHGDGTPIADAVVDEIRAVMDDLSREFPWVPGDILMVDNMLVAHARRRFSGDRRMAVALGDMVSAEAISVPAMLA